MDALRLPSLSVPTVRLPGQTNQSTPDKGNYIIVTSTANSVTLLINGVKNTFSVTPKEPTRIDVEELTTLEDFLYNLPNGGLSLDFSNCDLSKIKSLYRAFFSGSPSSINFGENIINATNMRLAFNQSPITTLDISRFNLEKLTDISNCFPSRLANLQFGYNLKISANFSNCNFTHDSALSVINGLAEVNTTKTVTFKSTTYATLTEEEIALATSKGWSVVSA